MSALYEDSSTRVVRAETARPPLALLHSKLAPPVTRRAPPLRRPHLHERLDQALGVPLTFVVAPAGYGKTTLLSEWVQTTAHRAGWLSLDRHDSNPVRFWSYVVLALTRLCPEVTLHPAGSLHSLDARTRLGTELLNGIHATGVDAVLVLDDHHAIDNAALHEELRFALDNLPSNLHVVIASRCEPPLGMARVRAHGQLIDVTTADLRFSHDEAVDLLMGASGVSRSDPAVDALVERAEGWPTGLAAGAAALRAGLPAEEADRTVADYLIAEVLERQPAEVQTFLLTTSIMDRLCAPLCVALLGEIGESHTAAMAGAALESLQRANLFLEPMGQDRTWFRYHRIFAEALRGHLRRVDPCRMARLHRAAAAWYTAEGMSEAAQMHTREHETLGARAERRARVTAAAASGWAWIEELTARELEVLRWAASGLLNRAIASKLNLSAGTVKWHLEQVYRKLDVHNRTQAIVAARGRGLLE